MTKKPRRTAARANGEGSLRVRADGRWEARLAVGVDPDTGKPRSRSAYAPTRALAAARLAEMQVEAGRGLDVQGGRVPLGVYLAAFARTRAPHVRPSTARNHDHYLRLIGGQPVAKLALGDVRARHLEAAYAALARAYSDSVVHHVRAFVGSAVKDAVRNELIAAGSATLAVAPRRGDARTARALTPEETARLLAELEHSRLYALVYTILATGLRIGEALGLQWSDHDPATGSLRVERSAGRGAFKATTGPTKTKAGRRTLYVTPALVGVWATWRERLDSEALHPHHDGGGGLIFPNEQGRAANPRTILRDFQMVTKRAGLGQLRLHDLRHTFATRLILRGADPRTVSALLGHTDARVTLAIYTHAQTETSKAALLMIDLERSAAD